MEETVPQYWKNLSLESIAYLDEEGFACVEKWKDVVGYEGLYQVSDLGRVKSFHYTPKIIKQFTNRKGYVTVTLTDINSKPKTTVVHILVGKSFIENPENKPQINHIKGVKWFNVVSNLEWNTNGENGIHARKTGLCKQIAETASSAKLTNKEVLEIFNSGLSQSYLCEKYNATDSAISNIKTGRKWSSITGKVYRPKKMEVEKVIDIFNSPLCTKEIQIKFGVKDWTVREIKNGKRWGETTGKIYVKKDRNG